MKLRRIFKVIQQAIFYWRRLVIVLELFYLKMEVSVSETLDVIRLRYIYSNVKFVSISNNHTYATVIYQKDCNGYMPYISSPQQKRDAHPSATLAQH